MDKLKRYFIEKGYFTYLEKDNIDLIAEKGDDIIAVQFETGKSNTKRNIISLKKYKADKKLVVATNRNAEFRARQILAKCGKDSKIAIFFVKDVLSISK